MAGYAVIARIERVDPHLAGHERASAIARTLTGPFESEQASDPVDHPLAQGLDGRWTRVREAWAQTTFYLFDPEGWR